MKKQDIELLVQTLENAPFERVGLLTWGGQNIIFVGEDHSSAGQEQRVNAMMSALELHGDAVLLVEDPTNSTIDHITGGTQADDALSMTAELATKTHDVRKVDIRGELPGAIIPGYPGILSNIAHKELSLANDWVRMYANAMAKLKDDPMGVLSKVSPVFMQLNKQLGEQGSELCNDIAKKIIKYTLYFFTDEFPSTEPNHHKWNSPMRKLTFLTGAYMDIYIVGTLLTMSEETDVVVYAGINHCDRIAEVLSEF